MSVKKIRVHSKNYQDIFPLSEISFKLILKKNKLYPEIGSELSARDLGEEGFYNIKTFTLSEFKYFIEKVIETFPKNPQTTKNLIKWQNLLRFCISAIKKEELENE